ncbi:MAG: hypothetical protein K8T10_13495 [Candidatus Eremiobacteraeota bacterium]|nr:hypothetical protein [Candidatus Eremiobacteraeota bacterium]
MSTEVFNTATWNFLAGNRDVETIIRNNHDHTLVVRGGLASVLPTINCLRDLRFMGWKDFPEVSVLTPVNTLSSHSPPISDRIDDGILFKHLLGKSYGINVLERSAKFSDTLVVLLDDVGDNRDTVVSIEEMLKNNGNDLMIILPSSKNISPAMMELIQMSPYTTTFKGNNVFFSQKVEEAVTDRKPERILLVGKDPQRIFYSAIGAVDCRIVADSRLRNPEDLKIWDLVDMGKYVSVMSIGKSNSHNAEQSLISGIRKHLENDLTVRSTQPDYRFSTVADFKIAIDMI